MCIKNLFLSEEGCSTTETTILVINNWQFLKINVIFRTTSERKVKLLGLLPHEIYRARFIYRLKGVVPSFFKTS